MDSFIEFLKAIVFGIVEGITEWLPVSSTGHMIILNQFFSLEKTQGAAFYDFFLVIIQLGAIFAVILFFIKDLWPFGKKKTREEKKQIWITWEKILIASIPAGVLGVLFNDLMDKYLFNYLTVSITLIVYGVAFLAIEFAIRRRALNIKKRYHLNKESGTTFSDDVSEEKMTNYPVFRIHSVSEISIQYAFVIGLAQCLALIPGTSRSGVTICAALLLSIDRKSAAKFSFYLSVPAMLGGSLIKGVLYGINVYKGKAEAITGLQVGLILVSMVVAFGVSLVVIKYFMKMLRTKNFNAFGIYRIALGLVLLILFFTVNSGNLSSTASVLTPVVTNASSIPTTLLNKIV